jgi:hypothetical protein
MLRSKVCPTNPKPTLFERLAGLLMVVAFVFADLFVLYLTGLVDQFLVHIFCSSSLGDIRRNPPRPHRA